MTHCKNFVEIQPVILTDNGPAPVYDETARGAGRMISHTPGDFSIQPNPNHVEGAYENLQHHELRKEIEARGLTFEVGVSHLLPITDDLAKGTITFLDEIRFPEVKLPGLLAAAARAGRLAEATHVEIKIS